MCSLCNIYFADTNISCNPDGTVHWQALVRNNGDCTVVTPYKVQLQVRYGATGQFVGVQTQHYNGVFPPGDTNIMGDFCYHFQPGQTDMRIYIVLDNRETNCISDHLSPFIDVCTPNPTCPPAGPEFHDVPVGSTFAVDVNGLASAGAISGYADGSFRPEATTTRAQLAKIVMLAFGFSTDGVGSNGHFSDVATGNGFYSYIEAAYSRGLISGYGDGTFRPYASVSRAQVAKIVVNAAVQKMGLKLANPATPSFSDVPVGSTYFQYVETAKAAGFLSGYPDNTFRPTADATRGQISKIVLLASTPQHELNGHRSSTTTNPSTGSTGNR